MGDKYKPVKASNFTDGYNHKAKKEQEFKKDYYWRLHVSLLDFVDLIKEQNSLKAKLKTKILDVAHEVRQELEVCECCSCCKEDQCCKNSN